MIKSSKQPQMSRLTTLLFFLFALTAFSQGNNPYKGLGEEAEKLGSEILTLSQGRYNEFHDNDTIVRIGSALYNVYTQKIVGFVVEEGHSEATMKPEVVSMWLSVDPLARKFPELTPYNFVEGNPVMLIDPNGLSAEPPDGFQGEFWEDETGKYYNVGAVTGNNSDFVKQGSGGENGFYNSGSEMLGEVTVDGGQMDDHARTMQNPVVQNIHGHTDAAGEAIMEVAMMAAPIPVGLPIKGMRLAAAAKGGKELFNFSSKAAKHFTNPARKVPLQIMDDVIKNTKGLPDPRGSKALMHYSRMTKNGKSYNLEILYDKGSNSIWHFQYGRGAMGPLKAIPK